MKKSLIIETFVIQCTCVSICVCDWVLVRVFVSPFPDLNLSHTCGCSCWSAGQLINFFPTLQIHNNLVIAIMAHPSSLPFYKAKPRWSTITAILSLRYPRWPFHRPHAVRSSTNYTSLSWVDLQCMLWLGLCRLSAPVGTKPSELKVWHLPEQLHKMERELLDGWLLMSTYLQRFYFPITGLYKHTNKQVVPGTADHARPR